MSLHAIPAGARVLVDANILIYARRSLSGQCRGFLERCAQGEISGVLTTIGVAEFCHRRMMQEAQSRGLSGSNPAKALSQNPTLVRQLTQYRQDHLRAPAPLTEHIDPQTFCSQQYVGKRVSLCFCSLPGTRSRGRAWWHDREDDRSISSGEDEPR